MHNKSCESSSTHEPDRVLHAEQPHGADHASIIGSADRFIALSGDDDLMRDPMEGELDRLPTRRLRAMIDRAFKALDSSHPPFGAQARYDILCDVVEERSREAARQSPNAEVRESFWDNALYKRFELRIDGTLAAHMKYNIEAGRIALTDGVEHPEFRDQGVDATLLHHVLLNTHKRRLSVIPQCPMVFAFLADNPQYGALAASDALPSEHLHS